ncbi:MAG: hypothetical protein ACLFRV_06310 [Acidimicrobiales bacterium]
MLRGSAQPVHVAVEEIGTRWPPALGVVVGEVVRQGDLPRIVDDPAESSEIAASETFGDGTFTVEMVCHHLRLLGRHSHALPVEGVEAAHRVAHGCPPQREPPETLDMAALVGGEPVDDRFADRLGGFDHLGDRRRRE